MSLNELYTKGARVWVPDTELVWRGAELKENYTGQKQLRLTFEDGGEKTVAVKNTDELPPLRNPDILIGENDLTSMSYLHEPAVLYNLQVRFVDRSAIYTYCGIVLVAINPYEQLPIYDLDTIQAYSGQDMDSLDPHIFAVAEEAYKRMSRFEENQSIIVSGESGAGKTVSAKYAMRYFATVCGAEAETQVEKRVLASNPIMEAIGNAKTTRNDNSSRFGKFIEIGFSSRDSIIGANMCTYLLEKSRVVFQAPEERNYHIFYQLCAVSSQPAYKYLKLDDPGIYLYTNQGEAPIIDGVDDAEDFSTTCEALGVLGIKDARQKEIFRILSGVLHLGNVMFKEDEKNTESCNVSKTDGHLAIVSEMLGIDLEQIRNWLCKRKIVTATEVLTKPLTIREAYNAKDALAKSIYSRLFSWIVDQLNKALSASYKRQRFIGVLDIYGFETFEINSFEQFCINYANEKLQQQFCLHVFKLEQEEYVREEIEWSFIDFYDNQPCINLIEGRLGILDLLDEECKMPRGSDQNWLQKLYTKHSKTKHFAKPRTSQTAFIVKHFADDVAYEMDSFLEKNRDTVLEEHVNILRASEYELVAELFDEEGDSSAQLKPPKSRVMRPAKATSQSTSKVNKKTVGSQFRDSLKLLMETLFSTTPHYVRCIKPNDHKQSFTFEPHRAIQQLRACGVLETIRISAAGYPSRWTYPEFFNRYRVLARSKEINRKNLRLTCENIITKYIEDRDKYQFGKSKIFFRAGQVAYLEKLRSDRLRGCGVLIQKRVRGWLARRRYAKIQRSVRLVQTFGRGCLARRKALFLRRTAAATVVQAYWRRYFHQQRYQRLRRCIISVQSYARGLFGRQKFARLRVELKAIYVQKAVRGWLQRKRYKTVIRGVTLLQAHVRRRAAKRQLKQLKIEARSVEHIKKVAKGLENKIIELQQKLDEKSKEVGILREDQLQLHQLKNELLRLQGHEKESRSWQSRVKELEREVEALRGEVREEKAARDTLVREKDKLAADKDQVIELLKQEKEQLRGELEHVNEEVKKQAAQNEAQSRQRVTEATQQLSTELASERDHHQRLVKDYGRLQQRYDNLHSDVQLMSPQHRRTGSGLSTISLESEMSTEKSDLDLGYGSERKKDKYTRDTVNSLDWEKEEQQKGSDVGLVTRLQNRVKELERDRARLCREMERQEGSGDALNDPEKEIYETIKLQELEIEGARMKEELLHLRKSIAESTDFDGTGKKGGDPAKQFMDQFEVMREELERRRDECIQLRTLLASRSRSTDRLAGESYGGDPGLVNEDGELEMAYRTQKDLNKLLENEVQKIQKTAEQKEKELKQQLNEMKADNDRQQKLIGQIFVPGTTKVNLTMTPEAKIEATMQHEITRLTSENLDLREQLDKQTETIKKLKKALKIYAKRLKSTEASDVQAELEREMAAEDNVPAVKHVREREYTGMFEYRKEDEPLVIRNLILDLKPRQAATKLPGLPAFILFMSIRHTDYMNDDEKVRSLLTSTINNIKRVVKKRQDDVEMICMWLANTCRLLHNLKQYSGEKVFQTENTPKQNEHCLRNFDLSEYRQILSDLAVWIYQGLIKLMESRIQPMIVGAVLEHEAIAGLSGSKPTGMRGRQMSTTHDTDNKQDISLDALMKALDNFVRVLNVHAVDPELVKQVFRQLFYFICANALNNLLLRKDMCHWSKGMQMRYNISHLEQWMRDNKMTEPSQALDPIIQASQLLQARKTDADVACIVEMCSRLTTSQIIKILNLYTPVNEFEERVPISFIRKIQEQLAARQDSTQSLLMDTKFFYAVTFPFNPSSLGLETIIAPPEWGLGFLKRL